MPGNLAHRCWIVAYFVSWLLAAGGACGLMAAVAWCAWGDGGIDDDVGLIGIPVGAILGLVAARATVRSRIVHRVLGGLGVVIAAAGTVGALAMRAAAQARRGDGPFVGLGEAIACVVLLCVAAIGIAFFVAGATGWLAARTERRPGTPQGSGAG